MSRTAEEAMLVAAMEGDSEKLAQLAADTTATERRYLTQALNTVYDALVKVEDAAKAEFSREYWAEQRRKRERPPIDEDSYVGEELDDPEDLS